MLVCHNFLDSLLSTSELQTCSACVKAQTVGGTVGFKSSGVGVQALK